MPSIAPSGVTPRLTHSFMLGNLWTAQYSMKEHSQMMSCKEGRGAGLFDTEVHKTKGLGVWKGEGVRNHPH